MKSSCKATRRSLLPKHRRSMVHNLAEPLEQRMLLTTVTVSTTVDEVNGNTSSIAATEMWDPRCASTGHPATCSTPIAGWAPALSPPSLEPWNWFGWAIPSPGPSGGSRYPPAIGTGVATISRQ